MKKNRSSGDSPTIAPGLDTDAKLSQNASRKEARQGNTTRVTIVSLDEVDPS